MIKKFDAIACGWTLKRAEQNRTITPHCNNCKSYESNWRTLTERCRKHDIMYPSLCSDWSPQKSVINDAAYSQMAYLQITKAGDGK